MLVVWRQRRAVTGGTQATAVTALAAMAGHGRRIACARMLRRMRPLPLLAVVALVALALIGAGGCGRAIGEGGGPVVVAVVEVSDAATVTSAAGPDGGMGAGAGGGEAPGCAFDVEVDDIVPSSKTCTIYEQVSHGGRMMLPCEGRDGTATASFGEHEYRGDVTSGHAVLKHSYDFQEKDGCMWRVSGKIVGDPSAGRLRWTYSEEILEDDKSNCWATCTAHTSMRLTRVR